MITSLRCQNFKCFKDTGKVQIAPITLLVGENNSGKSSLLHALHLPSLTIQSDDYNICLKLWHQEYDYGSFEDIAFKHDSKNAIILSFGLETKGKTEELVKQITLNLEYGYLKKRKEIYLKQFLMEDEKGSWLKILQNPYTGSNKAYLRGYDKPSLQGMFERRYFLFGPRRDPLKTARLLRNKYDEKIGEALFKEFHKNAFYNWSFMKSFENLRLLGPVRVYPNRMYLTTGETGNTVGFRGEKAVQNYVSLSKRKKKEDKFKFHLINEALEQLGFQSELDMIGERFCEVFALQKESKFRANLIDSGFGISQVFPVVVELFTSPPESMLLLEQPEIHLHPAAQAELGSIIVKASSPQKRIIVETHSENLILRIQTEIAEGRVTPEDVRIYYIQPRIDGHNIVEIEMNDKGEFLTEWPKGFFEESYRESLKLAKARQEK